MPTAAAGEKHLYQERGLRRRGARGGGPGLARRDAGHPRDGSPAPGTWSRVISERWPIETRPGGPGAGLSCGRPITAPDVPPRGAAGPPLPARGRGRHRGPWSADFGARTPGWAELTEGAERTPEPAERARRALEQAEGARTPEWAERQRKGGRVGGADPRVGGADPGAGAAGVAGPGALGGGADPGGGGCSGLSPRRPGRSPPRWLRADSSGMADRRALARPGPAGGGAGAALA